MYITYILCCSQTPEFFFWTGHPMDGGCNSIFMDGGRRVNRTRGKRWTEILIRLIGTIYSWQIYLEKPQYISCLFSAFRHARGNATGSHRAECDSVWKVRQQQWACRSHDQGNYGQKVWTQFPRCGRGRLRLWSFVWSEKYTLPLFRGKSSNLHMEMLMKCELSYYLFIYSFVQALQSSHKLGLKELPTSILELINYISLKYSTYKPNINISLFHC